jgi:hypothetical protein
VVTGSGSGGAVLGRENQKVGCVSAQHSVPDARADGRDGTGRGALDGLRIADALELAVRDATNAVVLVSATTDGRDMAGRLAARLDAGLLIDAVEVDSSGMATQVVFGGSYTVRSQVSHGMRAIAVRPGAFEPEEYSVEAGEWELFLPPVGPAASGRVTARRTVLAGDRPGLTEASVIVSGGRGVAVSRERTVSRWSRTWPMPWATRWAPRALRWMPVTTCTSSEARILDLTDYGVVGDLFVVAPQLTQEVAARRAGSRHSPSGTPNSRSGPSGPGQEGETPCGLPRGPRVGCDVQIEAEPSRVWCLMTDIGLHARLSPELQRVQWLDGAEGPTVGARFAGYNHHRLIGDWRTVSHVVELEEQRVFGWVVVDPDGRFGDPAPDPSKPLATWRFEVETEGTGSRLRQVARIGPGRSGISLAIDRTPERGEALVAFRIAELRTNIEATLLGIKALAEEAR